MKKHIAYLEKLDACSKAVEWANQFETMQEAWDNCERGDWMMWLLENQTGKPESKLRKKLVLTTCKCVRLSLEYISKDEKRPEYVIETVEKWANGDKSVSLEDVKKVANDIHNTTYAVNAVFATYYTVAYAVAYAAYIDAALNAAARAAASINAYATGTTIINAFDVKNKVLKKCADIVRKDYPKIRMIK